MDPDAALNEILKLAHEAQNGGLSAHETNRLGYLTEALNDWIVNGGHLPSEWAE